MTVSEPFKANVHKQTVFFLIGLAGSLILLGVVISGASIEHMRMVQSYTKLFPDSLWQFINLFGHFLVAALMLLVLMPKAVALWALLLATIVGGGLTRLLKFSLHHPRPAALMSEDLHMIGETLWGQSMPSGHTMTIAIVFALICACCSELSLPARRLRFVLGFLVIAVGLARMASGAHWPADVCVGAGVGMLVGLFCAYLILRLQSRLPRIDGLVPMARLVLALILIVMPLPPSCSAQGSIALGFAFIVWQFIQRQYAQRPWSPRLNSNRQL